MYKKTLFILSSSFWAITTYGMDLATPHSEERPLELSANHVAKLSPVMQGLHKSMAEVVAQGKEDPFEKVLESEAFKTYHKKRIALDAVTQASQWALAGAIIKAGSDIASPYIQGALTSYAPGMAMKLDSLLAQVPETFWSQKAFCIAAASVGIIAGARRAYCATLEKPALDDEAREIITDLDLVTHTRQDLTTESLKGLWEVELIAEDASAAINAELDRLDSQYASLEKTLSLLEESIDENIKEKAQNFAKQSAQLKELLGQIKKISKLYGEIKVKQPAPSPAAPSPDAPAPAASVQPLQVEKRKRKAASGLAALGLASLLHKSSDASARSINDSSIMSPLGALAVSCGAALGLADLADRTITAEYHKTLRRELRQGADQKLEAAKTIIKESSFNVFAQDDVNTQALTQKASLVTVAMDEAHALMDKIKAHQITQRDLEGHPIVQQHAELVNTAELLVTKLQRKKKDAHEIDPD